MIAGVNHPDGAPNPSAGMKAIDDFELVSKAEHSTYRRRRPDAEPVEIVDAAPPHRRMRMEVSEFHSSLAFRGTYARRLNLRSEVLKRQFETPHGYLLLGTWTEGSPYFSDIEIYYLPRDLSDVDYASLMVWGSPSRWERFKQRLICAFVIAFPFGTEGPEPILATRIEDDHTLAVQVFGGDWYRIVVHDNPPRRWRFSCWGCTHENSRPWHRRYFSVRRASDIRDP